MTEYFTIFGMAVFIILVLTIVIRAIRWVLRINYEIACNERFRDKITSRVSELEKKK